uniref:Uncharacterized protein n=1 Tax=Cucumis melo TaxID=3656 RepID=A0A9I9DTK5_CUCME
MAEALEYKARPWARAACINERVCGARCMPMHLRGACPLGAAHAMRLGACVGRASQAHATAVGRARRVPRTPCLCERGDPSKGRAFLACKLQMSLIAMSHRDSARPYPHTTYIFIPIAMEVIAYVKGRKT